MYEQRYSQSRWLLSYYQSFPKCCRKEQSLGGIPASGSHSQPVGHFSVEWWNGTSQTVKPFETGGFVISAVNPSFVSTIKGVQRWN